MASGSGMRGGLSRWQGQTMIAACEVKNMVVEYIEVKTIEVAPPWSERRTRIENVVKNDYAPICIVQFCVVIAQSLIGYCLDLGFREIPGWKTSSKMITPSWQMTAGCTVHISLVVASSLTAHSLDSRVIDSASALVDRNLNVRRGPRNGTLDWTFTMKYFTFTTNLHICVLQNVMGRTQWELRLGIWW